MFMVKRVLKYPYIKYNFLKKFFKKNKKKIYTKLHIHKLSMSIFNFIKSKNIINIYLYNGRVYKKFYFKKLKIFLILGEFITTRIMNSGKILHKRKKK